MARTRTETEISAAWRSWMGARASIASCKPRLALYEFSGSNRIVAPLEPPCGSSNGE